MAQNAEAEWARRQKLNDLAVTVEEQQIYASKSLSANAQYQLALADLDNARLNLARTRIVSPVNGYVTNLLARAGDYANIGQREVSLIDADSFWVDAYFEETFLGSIHDGDAASVKLMGYPQVLRGHVQSLARGISVANATPSALGLATVNPIFAFVRLAQRVPVRIRLDAVPGDVRLVAGTTATVAIDPGGQRTAEASGRTPARVPTSPQRLRLLRARPQRRPRPVSRRSRPPNPAPRPFCRLCRSPAARRAARARCRRRRRGRSRPSGRASDGSPGAARDAGEHCEGRKERDRRRRGVRPNAEHSRIDQRGPAEPCPGDASSPRARLAPSRASMSIVRGNLVRGVQRRRRRSAAPFEGRRNDLAPACRAPLRSGARDDGFEDLRLLIVRD